MENIKNKMESLLFLIPASKMPPAGFVACVHMSCFVYFLLHQNIIFNGFTLCGLIVYLTTSCFIYKWFVLDIMAFRCTCEEPSSLRVCCLAVCNSTPKSSVLSVRFMLLRFETFCTDRLYCDKLMGFRVLWGFWVFLLMLDDTVVLSV